MNNEYETMSEKIHQLDKKFDGLENKIDTILEKVSILNTNQQYTNGKVRSLQMWRAGLTGATGVLTMISAWLVLDYMGNRYDTLSTAARQEQELLYIKQGLERCEFHIDNN